MKKITLSIFSIILLVSCISDQEESLPEIGPVQDFTEIDKNIIETYLQENELTAETTTSGLYYTIESQGEGNKVTASSVVKTYYKGSLTDDTVFDESGPEGVFFENINQLIPGFREGLLLLNNGGEATFYIPSRLGYQNIPVGAIPANSVLIFDVKLFEVN